MDIIRFLVIFVIIIIGHKLFQLMQVWRTLMNATFTFYKPSLSSESNPPAETAEIYKTADKILEELGFTFSHSFVEINPQTKQKIFTPVYQDVERKILAFARIREDYIYPLPFQITYETYLSNGEIVTTRDGISHYDLEFAPMYHVADGYFANPDLQLKLHRRRVEEISRNTQTNILMLTPEESLQKEAEMMEKQIDFWKGKYFKNAEDGSYMMEAYAALKFAIKFLSKNQQKSEMLKSTDKYEISNREAFAEADIIHLDTMKIVESSKSKNNSGYIISLIVSGLLFILGFGILFSWEIIPYVILILIIHELGHWIGMKIFKYQDSKVFFIPLLGAVTTGYKEDAPPFQKLTILLLGPLPGILIGILLLFLSTVTSNELLLTSGTLFVVLNYLNLLPISPLDGGKIVETFISQRFPLLTFVFVFLSAMILLISGLALADSILIVFGILMLFNTVNSWREYKAKNALKYTIDKNDDNNLILKKIIIYLYKNANEAGSLNRFNVIKSLKTHFTTTVPGKMQSFIGTGIYFITLFFPVMIYVFITFFSFFLYGLYSAYAPDWNEQLLSAGTGREKIEICASAGEFFEYEYGEIDSAIQYYKMALSLADSLDIRDDIYIETNLSLATLETDTSEIRKYLSSSLYAAEHNYGPNDPKVADVLSHFGKSQFKFMGNPEIENALTRAVQICDENNNPIMASSVKRNLAYILITSNNINDAELLLIESLNSFEMEVDSLYDPFVGVHILADLYTGTGRNSDAISLLNEFEDRYKELNKDNQSMMLADLLSHRGWIHLNQNNIPAAKNDFLNARDLFETISYPDPIPFLLKDFVLDICYAEIQENQLDRARKEFQFIENEFPEDYLEYLINQEEFSGDFFPSNVPQAWRQNRLETHKFVLKTLLNQD